MTLVAFQSQAERIVPHKRSATRVRGHARARSDSDLSGATVQDVVCFCDPCQTLVLGIRRPLVVAAEASGGGVVDNGSTKLWALGVVVGGKCLRLGCSWWGNDALLMLDPHAKGTLKGRPIPRSRRCVQAGREG